MNAAREDAFARALGHSHDPYSNRACSCGGYDDRGDAAPIPVSGTWTPEGSHAASSIPGSSDYRVHDGDYEKLKELCFDIKEKRRRTAGRTRIIASDKFPVRDAPPESPPRLRRVPRIKRKRRRG
jgi:hypothetical protein